FFQAEDGIRDGHVTGVQTCALPIFPRGSRCAALRRGWESAVGILGTSVPPTGTPSARGRTLVPCAAATRGSRLRRIFGGMPGFRSEERRVGKECRSRMGPEAEKRKG